MKIKRKSTKGIVKFASAILLATGIAACSESADQTLELSPQKVNKAPTSQKDTGFLVEQASASQVLAATLANPKLTFRILNKNHGLYEIFGVDRKTMEEFFPQAEVSKNQFIAMDFQNIEKFDLQDAAETFQQAPGQPPIQCRRGVEPPIVKLTKGYPSKTDVIKFGETIKLSGKGSTNHPKHKGKVIIGWVINTPGGSKLGRQIKLGESLEYQPDTIGPHTVVLVVQDSRQVCSGQQFLVQVTSNPKFQLPTVSAETIRQNIAKYQKDNKVDLFPHLNELNTKAAELGNNGKDIVIAVIDSGVNYNHPFIAHNVLENEKEKNGQPGVDDDGNGVIDDVVGYDFHNRDPSPFDDIGHGSHVAALAASPVMGMAKEAKIISIKGLGHRGGDVGTLAASVYYAVDRGSDIINMSFGNYGRPHPGMARAIAYAKSKGVLAIAAAGNGDPRTGEGVNTDIRPSFPSAYPHSNLVAVASKDDDPNRLLAKYSNYGVRTVHVIAPGGGKTAMNSAYMDNAKGVLIVGMSGTSMAAPVVSGISALVLKANPNLKPQEVKSVLMAAGKKDARLKDLAASSRYIDAKAAVDLAKAAIVQP